jgi:hypothetical protein
MQMISIHLNKHKFDYVKHYIKNGAKLIEHCMFVVYYQSMIRNSKTLQEWTSYDATHTISQKNKFCFSTDITFYIWYSGYSY